MKKSLLLLTGLVVSFIVLASLSRPAKDNVGQNIWAVNLVDVWCAVLFKQGKLDEAKAEYGRGVSKLTQKWNVLNLTMCCRK